VSAVRLSGLDRNVSAIVIDMEAVSLVIPWCTWYKNPCFALHKKRTQHGQLRSIAVCCGQPKTPITLQQFAKTQVGKSVLVIARFFAKVMLNLVYRLPSPMPAASNRAPVREVTADPVGSVAGRSAPAPSIPTPSLLLADTGWTGYHETLKTTRSAD
jgi:hypothetical protein